MNSVLGDILPFAVAVAISPVPIIATILMLMSPRPRPLGLSFLTGWILGIVVAIVVCTILGGIIPAHEASGSQPIIGIVQLVLAAALLFLALKQWRNRPRPGETAALPKWMAAIDTMKPGSVLVLGFALAAANPKNLVMAIAAGASIGHGSVNGGETTIIIIVFVVIAALSVAGPVAAALIAPKRAATALDGIRAWLTANNSVIMAVLLLLFSVQLLGKAIGNF